MVQSFGGFGCCIYANCANQKNDDDKKSIDTSKFIGAWWGFVSLEKNGTTIQGSYMKLNVTSKTEYNLELTTNGTTLKRKGTYTATDKEITIKDSGGESETYSYTLTATKITLKTVDSGYNVTIPLVKQ